MILKDNISSMKILLNTKEFYWIVNLWNFLFLSHPYGIDDIKFEKNQ